MLLNPGGHPSEIGPSLLQLTVVLLSHYLLTLLRSVDSEGVVSNQWSEAHIICWAAGTRRTAPTTDRNYTLFRCLGTIRDLLWIFHSYSSESPLLSSFPSTSSGLRELLSLIRTGRKQFILLMPVWKRSLCLEAGELLTHLLKCSPVGHTFLNKWTKDEMQIVWKTCPANKCCAVHSYWWDWKSVGGSVRTGFTADTLEHSSPSKWAVSPRCTLYGQSLEYMDKLRFSAGIIKEKDLAA